MYCFSRLRPFWEIFGYLRMMDLRSKKPAMKNCLGCPEQQDIGRLSTLRKRAKAKPKACVQNITLQEVDEQALKYRRGRAINNLSSKKYRDRKREQKQQDEQTQNDDEERRCLMEAKVNNLIGNLKERTRQLERILTDCPDCNKSPHIQNFVKESKIERGVAVYECLWYHFQIQGWIAKDARLSTYLWTETKLSL